MLKINYEALRADLHKLILLHVDFALIEATPELKEILAKDEAIPLNISKYYLKLFMMRDESVARLGLVTRLLGTLGEQAIEYLGNQSNVE